MKTEVHTEGPKPATRGGVNGSRSKFLSKSIRRPISRKSPQTLNLRYENSYGLAISQQHTLENFAEAKEPTRCESQNTAEGTGQTAHWDWSDRSGWSRRPRPVRPVSQTGRSQTARNQSSKWQISSKRSPNPRNLEDSFASTPWTYPQKIFLKRLTDRENLEDDQRGLGFSQELTKTNSGELVIPEGLALG